MFAALIFIFAFAWFVGWAVVLRQERDDVIDLATGRRTLAVAFLFVFWPAFALDRVRT